MERIQLLQLTEEMGGVGGGGGGGTETDRNKELPNLETTSVNKSTTGPFPLCL